MTTINLRDFYPHYNTDAFVEVSNEVAESMLEAKRKEAAYQLRTYRHKAYYSLDIGDGIESAALLSVKSPGEIYEQKQMAQQLADALDALPTAQARRLYAHYILGMSKTEIAKAEDVDESTVRITIGRGLRNLKNLLDDLALTCPE